VAILYKCVPLCPWFLAIPGASRASVVALILEIDVVALVGSAFVFVVQYATGDPAARVLPETTKRIRNVTGAIVRLGALLVSVVHFWAASDVAGPVFVKWTLRGFGVFWLINLIYGIVSVIRRTRKAGRKKTTFPEFNSVIGPDWVALLLALVFTVVALPAVWALVLYLRDIKSSSLSWVICLGAASQALVFLTVVLVLVFRIFYEGHRSAHLALERAVVVEGLSASEIKSRFIAQLLGAEVAVWLEGIRAGFEQADIRLRETVQSVSGRVPDVESVDKNYALERRGRAEELVRELQSAISEYSASYEKGLFQLGEYAKLPIASAEKSLLDNIVRDLETLGKRRKGSLSDIRDLHGRLRELANGDRDL